MYKVERRQFNYLGMDSQERARLDRMYDVMEWEYLLGLKALSVKYPYASMIADGSKTIETRWWRTKHRGPLVICSTKDYVLNKPGRALVVVDLIDCRPMTPDDTYAAGDVPYFEKLYAWVLGKREKIKPFPVRGMPGIFTIRNVPKFNHVTGEVEYQ